MWTVAQISPITFSEVRLGSAADSNMVAYYVQGSWNSIVCNSSFVVFFFVCFFAYMRCQLSNRGLTNKLSMVVNVTVLNLLLSCQDCPRDSLIKNTNCDKKWKNKEFMKKVFLCLQHDGNKIKKTLVSCTLKYTFNWPLLNRLKWAIINEMVF